MSSAGCFSDSSTFCVGTESVCLGFSVGLVTLAGSYGLICADLMGNCLGLFPFGYFGLVALLEVPLWTP